MTLCVATQDPLAPAETYVRQHIRLIAPGATVCVAFAAAPTAELEVPLFRISRPPQGWRSRASGFANLLTSGYPIGVPPLQRADLRAFLGRHGVRSILAEFGPTGASLMSFARHEGLPLVVNFHGHDATVMPQRRTVRYGYRRLARSARRFVCGSQHFRRILVNLGFPADRIEVIPCGVEPERFTIAPDRDPHRLIAVGRLTPKKSPTALIRAFAGARAECPGLQLDVVGDGPLAVEARALVQNLGLSDCVHLHGALPHAAVIELLGRASLFVQHSVTAPNGDQESQGISLLEAMASSLPVVTTDHNGFSETVMHGVTGLLSPEHDIAAMTAHIVQLVREPARAAAMGCAGRDRVISHFDAVAMAARLRACLA